MRGRQDPQYSTSFSVAPEASHWSPRENMVLDLNFQFYRWANCGPERKHGQLKGTCPVNTVIET